MKTIGIYSRKINLNHRKAYQSIISEIEGNEGKVIVYEPLLEKIKKNLKISNKIDIFKDYNELKKKVKLLISIGGDGTLLDSVTYVRDSNIPILGINIGRLGFLSNIDINNIKLGINAIFTNNFCLSKRSLLELKSISNTKVPDINFAINDITISKKDSNSMIVIHTLVNNLHLNTYWADGLIVSTPTGSTAYSLSCSGPITTPDCENFIITPIAPHNLSVRPVIIPDNAEIKLIVESRNKFFNLTLDSRTISIKANTEIIIKKANFNINLATLHDNCFFQIIRDKLHWGDDKRN